MLEERWVEKARLFSREKIRPLAGRFDREGTIPPNFLREMAKDGFFGLTIPSEYGGSSASAQTIAHVVEEVAAESLAVAIALGVHLSVASAPIVQWGSGAQKKRFLPSMAKGEWLGAFALTEPGTGSDAQHLSTRYVRSGEGFLLSGTKTFITNGAMAKVVLVFATRDPSLGANGISCFLVEKEAQGFSVSRHLEKLGLRASETTELLFDECRVGKEALMGREGEGFKVAMTALEGGRIGIASSSLGVARRAMEIIKECARVESQEWKRSALAGAYVEVEAARALIERAVRLKDSEKEYGMAASAAKLFASQAAFRLSSKAMDLAVGGAAEREAERLFRDARVLTLVEGTTEIQEFILGRALT